MPRLHRRPPCLTRTLCDQLSGVKATKPWTPKEKRVSAPGNTNTAQPSGRDTATPKTPASGDTLTAAARKRRRLNALKSRASSVQVVAPSQRPTPAATRAPPPQVQQRVQRRAKPGPPAAQPQRRAPHVPPSRPQQPPQPPQPPQPRPVASQRKWTAAPYKPSLNPYTTPRQSQPPAPLPAEEQHKPTVQGSGSPACGSAAAAPAGPSPSAVPTTRGASPALQATPAAPAAVDAAPGSPVPSVPAATPGIEPSPPTSPSILRLDASPLRPLRLAARLLPVARSDGDSVSSDMPTTGPTVSLPRATKYLACRGEVAAMLASAPTSYVVPTLTTLVTQFGRAPDGATISALLNVRACFRVPSRFCSGVRGSCVVI